MPDMGTEAGRSGLNIVGSGYIEEEFLPSLSGRQAITTYREMKDNDPIVGAIIFCIDMLARQVEWSVEQGDAEDDAVQFLEECMNDMSHSWGDLISEILSMIPFGFSFHEIVYKRRSGPQKEGSSTPASRFSDGKIGWRKIPMRAQETLDRWEFDDNGGLQGFVQKPPPDFADRIIPIQKGLLFRTSTYKNNPEGRSLLRNAYRPWYYKKRIEEIEGVGIERDLAGFPVIDIPLAYLDVNAEPDMQNVRAAFEKIGQNIRRDKQEYLLMPSDVDPNTNQKMFDIRLLSSGGTRSFDTTNIITRYSQHIAMTVLADFILLGHENVGSFALSSDKTDLFAVELGTMLDVIADVFNRFAVPRLFALNGMDLENLPTIEHGDIETQNLGDLANYVAALVNAGVPLFPDVDLEDYLRRQAKLPDKSEETKRLQEQQAESGDNGGGNEIGGQSGGPGGAGAGGGSVVGGQQPPQLQQGTGGDAQQGNLA